jgi:RND family efflux transporter MFP subunit
LLAVLNGSTTQNAYEVAKSTLYQAQDAYGRIKSLHDKGSVTDMQLVEVESGLEKAKAMEAIAKKSVEDCNLYAPMNGVISKRSVEEGVSVMPGLSAFKIVSIDEVYINVPVPENEIGSIKTGQAASVAVPALGHSDYKGVVDKKGVEGNPVSRTYAIKIKTGNPKLELMPGMVCKVFLYHEAAGNILIIVIPNRTVQIAHDNRHFVWLTDGNVARRRFITVGLLSQNGVVVENGLAPGDRLIVEGYQKVSEGMQINIVK